MVEDDDAHIRSALWRVYDHPAPFCCTYRAERRALSLSDHDATIHDDRDLVTCMLGFWSVRPWGLRGFYEEAVMRPIESRAAGSDS